MFTIVYVHSPSDDRTARARIRDEALQLFAEYGPDAVTVRGIAERAGVSPALVIRHYGSKDGLRAAVDDHVTRVFEAMLAQLPSSDRDGRSEPAVPPSFVDVVARSLPQDSAIATYLGRMLLTGGPAGSELFRRLHDVSRATLAELTAAGSAVGGADPEVRAAFLLVNDLAVMILRPRLSEVLGVDPLSPDGLRRWGTEVLSIYRDGLVDGTDRARPAAPTSADPTTATTPENERMPR